jgi:hypothetical protein
MAFARRVRAISNLAMTAPMVGEAQAPRDTPPAAAANAPLFSNFRFIPRELAIKCRRLIESYHAIYGYVSLPDMLWRLSDARDIIEHDRELTRMFSRAARSRAAKRANDSLRQIATTIVSIEVLARDFSGWGKRFPAAKGEADKMLAGSPLARRAWLMDLYLFRQTDVRRVVGDSDLPADANSPGEGPKRTV